MDEKNITEFENYQDIKAENPNLEITQPGIQECGEDRTGIFNASQKCISYVQSCTLYSRVDCTVHGTV
jgi:hypothetical protein